ncbi:Gfo/Idh/MocA family oxidoreductase [Pelagibacterium sp. H642]|uniref:Gfo/Idh/MocA family protein n=1 Tax=Pelagibacterium sp. H642 TaxID=1881069 RepID=UPI00281579E9|nr:Gfo/Idh/MocA family oxidoreductase [Pelagibacterium sp. H642]WMT91947.1 Gfo/Idh/MocA family oxidoreductase [Pelagibacterium sp. H642]
MSEKNLRVGLLGCGHISRDHLIAWANCPGADVVAVCDPVEDRAAAQAEAFSITAVYTDPAKMMAEADLGAVDIVTPRHTHAGMIRLAAENGLHALCEKPLCPTLEQAEALVAEIGDRVRVMVNENWRYREYFEQIRMWIAEGRLGTITQARIALWRSNMLPRPDGMVPALSRQPFVAKEERLLVAESLIHELDTVRSLFGELRVVAARLGRYSDRIIGEDAAAILLEADAGHAVVVEGVMTSAGHAFRAPNRLEIAGTRASVTLDGARLRLHGPEEDETIEYDENKVRQGCFDGAIAHFVEGLATGKPFLTSARDQINTLRLLEDVYGVAGPLRRPVGALAGQTEARQ